MSATTTFILWAFGGYLLGSIPFGLILCRIFGYGDIRKSGSGNIGATNVLRCTKSKTLALLTILFDAAKAGVIAYIARQVVTTEPYVLGNIITQQNILTALIAGVAAVIGHNFPLWLRFKGGKGVASSFGLILALVPYTALTALAIWIVAAIVFRYSSLAAIIAAIATPLVSFFYNDMVYTLFITGLALLLLIRHRANFVRLIKGEETKISFQKKSSLSKSAKTTPTKKSKK